MCARTDEGFLMRSFKLCTLKLGRFCFRLSPKTAFKPSLIIANLKIGQQTGSGNSPGEFVFSGGQPLQ